jgi:hypothetical protein
VAAQRPDFLAVPAVWLCFLLIIHTQILHELV